MTSALQALSKFERLARSYQVDEILAVATSATREAENGGEFLARDRANDGHPAAHHHRHRGSAADSSSPPSTAWTRPRRAVVIDIGGGSVEITLGTGQQVQYARSFKIGVIRLTERFVNVGSAERARRAQDGRGTSASRSAATRSTSSRPASIASSARRARSCRIGTVATAMDRGTRPVGDAQSAGSGEEHSPVSQDRERARSRGAAPASRARSAARRPDRSPARCCSTPSSASCGAEELTLCDLALREGLVLDYIRRSTVRKSRASTSIPTFAAARRSSWPSGATGRPSTRSR